MPTGGEFSKASSVQLRNTMKTAEEEGVREACYGGLRSVGPHVAGESPRPPCPIHTSSYSGTTEQCMGSHTLMHNPLPCSGSKCFLRTTLLTAPPAAPVPLFREILRDCEAAQQPGAQAGV